MEKAWPFGSLDLLPDCFTGAGISVVAVGICLRITWKLLGLFPGRLAKISIGSGLLRLCGLSEEFVNVLGDEKLKTGLLKPFFKVKTKMSNALIKLR